ncbi:uncharacterized protein LOC124162189 [Ischnura elegans]|uniref:uncharacterized protein LOC124162189 n=1 Tax=Ischnura elegans TaxID=197161 RepID=UPI001ED8B7B1|nr:uncharacterized protein LOC124162189 [Ischnura elegans]
MGLIAEELDEVKKLCEHVIPGTKLVSCVPTMVRVEIRRTTFKHFVVCIQFPADYPKSCIIVELKSKVLSAKLLDGLTSICEGEAKKILGKPQILPILKFLRNFIDENPLSCCYDEISSIRKNLLTEADELKLKQKISTVSLKVCEDSYFFKAKLLVPDEYPLQAVSLDGTETNLPPAFTRFIVAQCKEISRQCIEPPIFKKGKKPPPQQQQPFQPKPSLEPVVSFLVGQLRLFPKERCQFCKNQCLPSDPSKVEVNESADQHVERIYCGHLFHLCCLITYMKTPPFKGGKKCPACQQQIFTERWRVGESLAEKRWAHHEARQRELEEVADFLQ